MSQSSPKRAAPESPPDGDNDRATKRARKDETCDRFVVNSMPDTYIFSFTCADDKRREFVLKEVDEALEELDVWDSEDFFKRLAGVLEAEQIPAEIEEINAYVDAIAPREGEWTMEEARRTVFSNVWPEKEQ